MSSTVTLAGSVVDAAVPRLGFLGVGWIGLTRMQALVTSGAGTVVGIADPSAERLAAAHAGLDTLLKREPSPAAPSLGASLDELLELKPDGIVIATPSALHADQCIRALEAGVAVFCQKPLGRTAAETRDVIDAARRADRLLGVDLSYRHTAAMQAVRELVRSGDLGGVYAVDLVFHNSWGPDRGWARSPELAGGGCVIDLGIHLIDLALWTLDYPAVADVHSRLFCEGKPLQPGAATCEDLAFATVTLQNGVVLRLACSWESHHGRDATIEASFHGQHGTARMRNVDGSFYDFMAERVHGNRQKPLVSPPDEWGGRALVQWAQQLGTSNRFDPDVEHLVDVAVILDRVLGQ